MQAQERELQTRGQGTTHCLAPSSWRNARQGDKPKPSDLPRDKETSLF